MSNESEQVDFEQLDSHSFSDDLLASGQSSSSYADLCCGESDVLHDRQLFRSAAQHDRPACEPVVKAKLQSAYSEPAPSTSTPKFGDGQHDVVEMVRCVAFIHSMSIFMLTPEVSKVACDDDNSLLL